MNKGKIKTFFRISGNVLFYLLLVLLLLLAGLSITSRVTGGRIGNSQYLVVISSSMDGEEQSEYPIKTIPIGSLIKDEVNDNSDAFYSSLKKGDILTFNYTSLGNETITHRIIEDPVKTEDGTFRYVVKGDAVEDDCQVLYSDGRSGEIIGKVVSVNLPLGKFMLFLTSKKGMAFCVIIPCTLGFCFEIYRIFSYVFLEKKKKTDEKKNEALQAKDKEIEELKKQLAEQEKKKDS